MANDGSPPTPGEPQVNLIVLCALAGALLVCIFGELSLGLASWWTPAADGQGTNAVREDVRTVITFILGVFAGVVQARVIGAPKP